MEQDWFSLLDQTSSGLFFTSSWWQWTSFWFFRKLDCNKLILFLFKSPKIGLAGCRWKPLAWLQGVRVDCRLEPMAVGEGITPSCLLDLTAGVSCWWENQVRSIDSQNIIGALPKFKIYICLPSYTTGHEHSIYFEWKNNYIMQDLNA